MADLMKQEAISTLPMRLIDANALLRPDENSDRVLVVGGARQAGKTLAMAMALAKRKVEAAPTIDAVPVVRCEDCKHEEKCMKQLVFWERDHVLEQNVYQYHKLDFCSYGERRADNA